MLAQALVPASGDWTQVVSTVLNIGFACFVGWYLLSRAIPKMLDDSRAELSAQRKDFIDRDRDQAALYRDSLRDQLAAGKEALALFAAHCEAEVKVRDGMIREELQQVSLALRDSREVMEEVRDELHQAREHRQQGKV